MSEKKAPRTRARLLEFWENWIRHNLMLKILSLIFALILWSYVIVDDNTQRTKTLNNVALKIDNQSYLQETKKMIVVDPSVIPGTVSCKVRIKQSDYANIDRASVRVKLNLADISTPGVQNARLEGELSGVQGTVEEIIPPVIEIDVDDYVSKVVPVKVERTGEVPENVYVGDNKLTYTPKELTLRGASKIVSQVSEIRVPFDLSKLKPGRTDFSLKFYYYDQDGNEMDGLDLTNVLNILVTQETLPRKAVPIEIDEAQLLIDEPNPDFFVERVEVHPKEIHIAADAETLSQISKLSLEPFSIKDQNASFTRKTKINFPNGVLAYDMNEVDVVVTMGVVRTTRTFEGIEVQPERVMNGYRATTVPQNVSVTVTGRKSQVEALTADDVHVYVSCDNKSAGTYLIGDPRVELDEDVESLSSVVSPASIEVRIQ